MSGWQFILDFDLICLILGLFKLPLGRWYVLSGCLAGMMWSDTGMAVCASRSVGMPKVMVLDNQLSRVLALEKNLKAGGYDVRVLTGPYGILAKFDFERPDILLFNPDMPNTDTDVLLSTIMASPRLQNMIVVLICSGEPDAIEEYCHQMNLHGYYMTDAGLDGIVDYLNQFCE
jgi:CheY-like chemotaxis protein